MLENPFFFLQMIICFPIISTMIFFLAKLRTKSNARNILWSGQQNWFAFIVYREGINHWDITNQRGGQSSLMDGPEDARKSTIIFHFSFFTFLGSLESKDSLRYSFMDWVGIRHHSLYRRRTPQGSGFQDFSAAANFSAPGTKSAANRLQNYVDPFWLRAKN